MSNILDFTLVELVERIKKKDLSSKEVTKTYIERSKKSKKLNTYITEDFESALKKADNFDSKPDFDKKLPGIPIAVKDLFCTKNTRTTAGSKILENFIPTYESTVTNNIIGKKIGIPKEYRVDGMPKEIEDLWQKGINIAKDAGAEIVDVSLPNTNYALPTYYIVAPAEASSNLARYDGVKYGFRSEGKNLIDMYEKTRSEGFGNEVKRRIMIGTYVLSSGYYDAYYLKAQKVRRLIKNDFDEVYKKVDAILTPSTPSSAFKIGEKTNDPLSMYLNDIFTVPINLAGLPAISIPAGHDQKGYPLGLQIIGKAFDEQNILNIAYSLEQEIKFKNKMNDWWL